MREDSLDTFIVDNKHLSLLDNRGFIQFNNVHRYEFIKILNFQISVLYN